MEIKRLEWTQDRGRNCLLERYGKRSRQILTGEEFLDFLEYLRSQPTGQTDNINSTDREYTGDLDDISFYGSLKKPFIKKK